MIKENMSELKDFLDDSKVDFILSKDKNFTCEKDIINYYYENGEKGINQLLLSLLKAEATKMTFLVDITFREYSLKRDAIVSGFISSENVAWLTDTLHLKTLTDTELSSLWFCVDEYFSDKLYFRDHENNLELRSASELPVKDGLFFRDTSSAWLEVINVEARLRKELASSQQNSNLDKEKINRRTR